MGSSRDHLRRNVDLADAEYSKNFNEYLLSYENGWIVILFFYTKELATPLTQ